MGFRDTNRSGEGCGTGGTVVHAGHRWIVRGAILQSRAADEEFCGQPGHVEHWHLP